MKQLLPLFIMTLILASCGGDSVPDCVDEKLQSFRTEACETVGSDLGGNLVEFTFRTETVYCFNWGACQPDKLIEIWEEDCGLLCTLGGPNNIEVCDGVSWSEFAIEEETVFQN